MSHPSYILLFGAGASKPKLPTAAEMTDKLVSEITKGTDDELKHALSFVLGGIHFLRGCEGEFPHQDINIEHVAMTLDALCSRQRHELSPFVGSWNELLQRFEGGNGKRRHCLDDLRRYLQDAVVRWLETPAIGDIDHLGRLKDLRGRFGCPVAVFTLNYDLCIEHALEDREMRFTTGFTPLGWSAEEFAKPEYDVRLYKLHGSLAWYRDDDNGAIYSRLRPPQDRVPVSDTQPLIIFGIQNKMQPVDPFLHLSFTFSEQVKVCKVIGIVGYGFGDDYINRILGQGLARDSRKRLVVVDLHADQAMRIMRERFSDAPALIDAGRVSFVEGGVVTALKTKSLCDEIAKMLDEASDSGPF